MIQLEQVNKYIEDLKFKKRTMGGVDELDALNHMKDICDIYEEEIERLKTGAKDALDNEELVKKDEIIDALKEKVEQLGSEKEQYKKLAEEGSGAQRNDDEIEKLQDRINSLVADNEALRRTAVNPSVIERKDRELERLNSENYQLRTRIGELEEKNRNTERELKEINDRIEEEKQEAESIKAEYEKKYNEIKELSEYIPMIKKDAQERAAAEAEKLLVQANIEAQTIREESVVEKQKIEDEIEEIRQAKDDMKRSVLDTMQKYDELMKKINAEMESE